MDDGSYTGSGIRIYTNAFTLKEIDLLINAFNNKLGLKVNKHIQNKNQYALYIPKKELLKIVILIKEFIHPTMIYKIGLKNS